MDPDDSREEFRFNFNSASLAGRTVVVAGGTGGLGSAVVVSLAREGVNLIVGYRRNRQKAERLKQFALDHFSNEIILVQGDLREAHVRHQYVEAAARQSGGLYGVVCFPGDPSRVKFEVVEEADLVASFVNNYVSVILLAREAAEEMRREDCSGAVVFVSTMQALAAFESSVPYAGPKAALVQAARILAKQWGGPGGIRVNVVAPGVNSAGMALQSIASGKYDHFVEKGIIPRFGRPEDVARVVRLFLEPDSYLTGQVVLVDGGLTLRRDLG